MVIKETKYLDNIQTFSHRYAIVKKKNNDHLVQLKAVIYNQTPEYDKIYSHVGCEEDLVFECSLHRYKRKLALLIRP